MMIKMNFTTLQEVLDNIPTHDMKLIIGDYNAKIGPNSHGMEQTTGPHGSATGTNDNGERLQLMCSMTGLSIGNTFFKH